MNSIIYPRYVKLIETCLNLPELLFCHSVKMGCKESCESVSDSLSTCQTDCEVGLLDLVPEEGG